jgi:AAA domain
MMLDAMDFGSPETRIESAGGIRIRVPPNSYSIEQENQSPEAGEATKVESADERRERLIDLLDARSWINLDIPAPDRLLGDLLTTTTRMFIVGKTGLGKTMLGFALAVALASGTDFLHWKSNRPARVVCIDGEMPTELIKQRIVDAARRAGVTIPRGNLMIYGADRTEEITKEFPDLGPMPPLNCEAGHNWVMRLVSWIGGVDVIILDNVMSLIAGDQKDEIPWTETMPLVMRLSGQKIAQIWLDHAGHNTDRQYGSSTKAWRFDAVAVLKPFANSKDSAGELGFYLSFEKARRRTPANWHEFEQQTIRLVNDKWTNESLDPASGNAPRLKGDTAVGLNVLTDLTIRDGVQLPPGDGFPTTPMQGVNELAWRREFYRRLDDRPPETRKKAFQRMVTKLRDANLIAMCDGRVWLVHPHD